MKIVGIIIAVVLAIWVYTDIQKIGMEDENVKDPLIGKRLAWRWTIGTLLLWIVFFPYYLMKRKEFLQNKQFLNK